MLARGVSLEAGFVIIPGLSQSSSLLAFAFLAVIGLVALVAWLRLNAFAALVLASLFVGLTSGQPLPDIVKAFQEGMGGTLGSVAAIIALGAMLANLLARSGGAEVVARRLADSFGHRLLPLAMLCAAVLIGIPSWFVVGLVLLMPILIDVARQSGLPFLRLGLPVVAALSVMHSLVPPHPGAMKAVEELGADVGRSILWTLSLGIPAAALAGLGFGRWASARWSIPIPSAKQIDDQSASPPSFWLTLLSILLPILLMLAASGAEVSLPKGHGVRSLLAFLGSPLLAMLLAFLFSLWSLGRMGGLSRAEVSQAVENSLGPVGAILLVVGGGGGFSKVMQFTGTSTALAEAASGLRLSPLLLAWLVAALIRLAVGSSTVAITTTAGLLSPILAASPGVNPALLVAVLGAGSLFCSHVNDGGFWFVKECFGMSVADTLRTWTVATSVASLTVLFLGLVLNALF